MGQVSDVRPTAPRYKDRAAAARRLATALSPYRERRPLVLGTPPGGATMAEIVARELGGDLDVALVRPFPAPRGESLAIGAVTEGGTIHLQEGWRTVASESYVKAATAEVLERLTALREGFTPRSLRKNPAERLVIFLDDGTSTPSMLAAAILSFRESGARMVVAACALASIETAESLRREADVVVVLRTLEPFCSASSHFEEFGPKSDSEIRESLRRAWRKPFTRGGG